MSAQKLCDQHTKDIKEIPLYVVAFMALDKNKDGSVSREEMGERGFSEDQQNELLKNEKGPILSEIIFNSLDKDGNGMLEKDKVVGEGKGKLSEDQFNNIDTNRSGKIDRMEFLKTDPAVLFKIIAGDDDEISESEATAFGINKELFVLLDSDVSGSNNGSRANNTASPANGSNNGSRANNTASPANGSNNGSRANTGLPDPAQDPINGVNGANNNGSNESNEDSSSGSNEDSSSGSNEVEVCFGPEGAKKSSDCSDGTWDNESQTCVGNVREPVRESCWGPTGANKEGCNGDSVEWVENGCRLRAAHRSQEKLQGGFRFWGGSPAGSPAGDGKLSEKEFISALTEDGNKELFKKMAGDDGELDKDEAEAYGLGKVFEKFDDDNSKKITLNEIEMGDGELSFEEWEKIVSGSSENLFFKRDATQITWGDVDKGLIPLAEGNAKGANDNVLTAAEIEQNSNNNITTKGAELLVKMMDIGVEGAGSDDEQVTVSEAAGSRDRYCRLSGGRSRRGGARKIRSNKGKKRGPYRSRVRPNNIRVTVNNKGNRKVKTNKRHPNGRKVRSNKGKKRGPRTGRTRSGKRFR